MPIQSYGTAAPRIGKVAPGRKGIIRTAMAKPNATPQRKQPPARKGRY